LKTKGVLDEHPLIIYSGRKGYQATRKDLVNSEPTINVIIVNWNSAAALKKCLASVMTSDYPSFRVIVVDNASNADDLLSLHAIQLEFQGYPFHVVKSAENRGYAVGNNTGLRFIEDNQFDGDILILNPDVVVERTTLRVLASAINGDVGIVTPRIIYPSGKVLLDRIRLKGYRHQYIVDAPRLPATTDVSQGTCMLVPRAVIEKIGLFDERFFLYWEEVDLSLRIKSAGYRLVSVNQTKVTKAHNSPARIPPCLYYSVRNANLIRKIHPSHFSRSGYFVYLVTVTALLMKLIVHPKLLMKAIGSVLCGIWDGAVGSYGARKLA
jgi:GT2 family glycosyltransferase